VFDFIVNIFSKKENQHPQDILNAKMFENYPGLKMKFLGYTRGHKRVYSSVGICEHLAYLDASTKEDKMNILQNRIKRAGLSEFGLCPQTVLDGEGFLNIPMIDFVGNHNANYFKTMAQTMGDKLPFLRGAKLFIFHSGNSYHGYVDKMIDSENYLKWGNFLLESSGVDRAWVKMGMRCLRWSLSKENNRKKPSLFQEFEIGTRTSKC